MKKFTERLKALRIKKGLSQRDLAKIIDYSQSIIVHWENDRRVPNINAIIELAKFFGVTADYLLGAKDYI